MSASSAPAARHWPADPPVHISPYLLLATYVPGGVARVLLNAGLGSALEGCLVAVQAPNPSQSVSGMVIRPVVSIAPSGERKQEHGTAVHAQHEVKSRSISLADGSCCSPQQLCGLALGSMPPGSIVLMCAELSRHVTAGRMPEICMSTVSGWRG